MDSLTNSAMGWYMNDSAENCTMLVAKVKMKARTHTDKNVAKVFKGDTCEGGDAPTIAANTAKANEALYDIILQQVRCAKLVLTLEQSYSDDGTNALKYITSLWHAGTDENRIEANHAEYKDLAWGQPLDETTEATAVRERLNKMTTLRNTLNGSDRQIADKLFSSDMIDVVRKMGAQHALEVQFNKAELKTNIACPGKIAAMLEGIALKARSDAPKRQ